MSRTEDDARTGTSARRASDDKEDLDSGNASSGTEEDGAVLPVSDWSVDDDAPAGIDPLLQRAKPSDDDVRSSGHERGNQRREWRARPDNRSGDGGNDDGGDATGELPIVGTARGKRVDEATTTPQSAGSRHRATSERQPNEHLSTDDREIENRESQQLSIDLPSNQQRVESSATRDQSGGRAFADEGVVRDRPVEQPVTERMPTAATDLMPTQRVSESPAVSDPRGWDVEDDLGPWQSHQGVLATAPPAAAVYHTESTSDVESGRRVVRRTTRILRHVDPWSTFKVGLLFSLVGYLVTMTSGYLLWGVAERTGTLDNVQRWFTQFGWETFELDGSAIFTNAAIAGLFLAVGATGAMVMFATIFNLASDAIGGIRMTVLEEQRVRYSDDEMYGHVDPSYGIPADPGGDWDLGD